MANLLTSEGLNYDPNDDEGFDKAFKKGLEELEDRNAEFKYIAAERRAGMNPELIQQMRRLAKTDRFFLAYSILGYERLSPNLHGHVCEWLKANQKSRFIELLLPRAHFKSTLETITGTIQGVLPDDVGDQPHPYNLGTNARILIVHEVSKMASGYLFSIIQHFMSNPVLMALFPECVPAPKKQKINSTELILPRTKISNEPTIGAMGVGGRSQGLHYDKLVLDDITGEKARESETEAQKIKDWFDSLPGFFDSYRKSRFVIVGTRWGPDDIYEHIEDRYEDKLKVYRRSIEEPDPNDLDEKGKPKLKTIFPEEIGPEDLEILKKNTAVFAAQYMNDPEGGNEKLDLNWCRKFDWSPEGDLLKVHSPEIHLKKIVHISSLNKVLLWDPAVKGLTGWCLVGTDKDRRHLVLESRQEILTPPQTIERFFELYAKYQYRCLAIEEVLFSELFRHWLETEFKVRGIRFNIVPVKLPPMASKELRVLGFSSIMAAGQIYLNPERYSREQDKTKKLSDLEYQIAKFGNIKDYHILDALANLEEVAMPGLDESWAEQMRKQEKEKLEGRSKFGYSKINYRKSY